jgi:hypothetical protein
VNDGRHLDRGRLLARTLRLVFEQIEPAQAKSAIIKGFVMDGVYAAWQKRYLLGDVQVQRHSEQDRAGDEFDVCRQVFVFEFYFKSVKKLHSI